MTSTDQHVHYEDFKILQDRVELLETFVSTFLDTAWRPLSDVRLEQFLDLLRERLISIGYSYSRIDEINRNLLIRLLPEKPIL